MSLTDDQILALVKQHGFPPIEAEATKPQEHKPLGPATAEDQAIYNSIVSNYFESGALDWMQNIDAAMKEPSFQEARALMGTENYGQDVALLQALRCLRSRMSNVTKPQEPTAFVYATGHEGQVAIKFITGKLAADGTVLFTTPQPCPKCAEGMVSVTKEDANNYCRILTLLGMEEEGSPVEGVERLISLREGMTCGDCNDTGWLENREEGRYPCTCMTEAEPYQILEAERDDWKSRYESNLSVNQMHSDNNAEMLKFNAKLLAERDLHKAKFEAINKGFDAMEAERDALKADYQQCCGLVANMHLAAMGGVIGPVRGVVEDVHDLRSDRDALAMQNQQMREALRVLLKFAETVGPSSCFWEDVWPEHENAECCDHSEIIKRHDAAVLRKAADTTLSEQSVLLDGMHGYTALKIQGLMIESLHLKADELEKS